MNKRRRNVKRVIAVLMTMFVIATTAYYGNIGPALAEAPGAAGEDQASAGSADEEVNQISGESDDGQPEDQQEPGGSEEGDQQTADENSGSADESGENGSDVPDQTTEENGEDSTADQNAEENGSTEETTEGETEDVTPTPEETAEPTVTPAPELTEQTLEPQNAQDLAGLADQVYISVSGQLPEGATVQAAASSVTKGENAKGSPLYTLDAFDIKVYNADGTEFQPAADAPLTVTISSNSIIKAINAGVNDFTVYHYANGTDAEPEKAEIESYGANYGIEFKATGFSVYEVTRVQHTATYSFYCSEAGSDAISVQTLKENEAPVIPDFSSYINEAKNSAAQATAEQSSEEIPQFVDMVPVGETADSAGTSDEGTAAAETETAGTDTTAEETAADETQTEATVTGENSTDGNTSEETASGEVSSDGSTAGEATTQVDYSITSSDPDVNGVTGESDVTQVLNQTAGEALGTDGILTENEDAQVNVDITVTPAQDNSNENADSEDNKTSLYDQLMAAQTIEEMDEILANASEEDAKALTAEQLQALIEKVNGFEDDADGVKAGVLATLNELLTGVNVTEETSATDSIVFKHIQTPNDSSSIGNDGTADGHGWNVMKYSIVLINLDGTVSYDLPAGSVVPDTYTFNSTTVDMSSALTQMGLSIPGYTLKDGWAFFWWTGNYSGAMYKVPYVRNFGVMNSNFNNVYYSYLGFQGLYGSGVTGSGSQAGYDAYMNATFASSSTGDNGYSADSSYYAYNPTGTLRIVFFQVSDKTKYKSNFVDAYDPDGTGANQTVYDTIDMNMTQNGNWSQETETYQWYGTLASVTTKTPTRDGYIFDGWYMSKDENGNGTGTKVTQASDDTTHYNQDAYYYAKWVPATKTLKITKQVTGNMGDLSKSFAFTVTSDKAMTQISSTDVSVTDDKIESGGMTASLNIKKGETVTITVPVNAKIEITESGRSGYTKTTYTVGNSVVAEEKNTGADTASYKISKISEDTNVIVTNDKDVTIPTGIGTDGAPYVLLLGLAAAGAGYYTMTIRRRRSRR